jgi:hypothetical protein
MTSHRTINAALVFMMVGGSGVAHAQDPHGKKAAPAPHAEKPAAAPHTEKPAPVPHAEKTAPAPHVQKPAPAARVEHVAPTPHVQKAVPVARVQHVTPTPHVQKPAPVAHVERPAPVPHAEQQLRITRQQQRAVQYRAHLAEENRRAQQQILRLQQQKRLAQYRFEQQYAARLAEQQRELQAARDYSRDQYVYAPYNYRYYVSGNQRLTNQYGADVLRQAVNYGYQEGFQSGQADRQDGWPASYQNSYAYSDANYGYTGYNVDQSDYNYYFRQGFRRGYDDGYYGRSQYGSYTNGTPSILSSLLSAILGLTSLR